MNLHLLHLKQMPIFEQLQLEEALLHADRRNWCLINEGSRPAIVMGISGKPAELVDKALLQKSPIPLIRRFSGGGTVVVDEETLFITFIFQKEVHPFSLYPEPILQWSVQLYQTVLPIAAFSLRENDYVIGMRKCGGNAQYLKKDRWLHHTTFLWDYCDERMAYLLHPARTPAYRQKRSHSDFLCRLRDFLPAKDPFIDALKKELSKRYQVREALLEEALEVCARPHRKNTVAENLS